MLNRQKVKEVTHTTGQVRDQVTVRYGHTGNHLLTYTSRSKKLTILNFFLCFGKGRIIVKLTKVQPMQPAITGVGVKDGFFTYLFRLARVYSK